MTRKKDDHDIVKCVCESNEENGDMLQCESCSAWCHHSLCYCVSISQVAANFTFICPFCIKKGLSLIPKLCSEISHLEAIIIKLERSITSLTNVIPSSQHSISTSSFFSIQTSSCTSTLKISPPTCTIDTDSAIKFTCSSSIHNPVSVSSALDAPSIPDVSLSSLNRMFYIPRNHPPL